MREISTIGGMTAGTGRGGIVEQRAMQWGSQRFEQDLEKKGPRGGIVLVVKETGKNTLALPKLVESDRRKGSLRYDSVTGAIYIPSWHELAVLEQGERRVLPNAEEFKVLNDHPKKPFDLTNLPRREVRELRIAQCADIHIAMRQTGHVMESFTIGWEAEQLEIIWREINQRWDLVLTGKITKDNLADLAEKTASVLRQHQLTQSEKQAKVNILKRLSGVFQRDSLGRLNPLIQRIRLRSAYLNAIGLEAFSVLVVNKYKEIEGVLMMEDKITKEAIKNACEALDTIMGFNKRGAWVFEGGKLQRGEAEGLEIALKGIVLLINRARVAPYLSRTRAAGITLWGCRSEKVEVNRRVVGEEMAHLFAPGFESVRQLITKGELDQAKRFARQEVFDPLKNLL